MKKERGGAILTGLYKSVDVTSTNQLRQLVWSSVAIGAATKLELLEATRRRGA